MGASGSSDTGPGAAEAPPAAVLAAWGWTDEAVQRIPGGLINVTYKIGGAGQAWVLQRLHPVFGAAVNIDLDAVTAHLARAGLLTPRLVATRAGDRWVEHAGAVWRALTFIDGTTLHAVPDPDHARAAGQLVGRVHRALADLDHTFAFQRAGVHDTAAHLARLTAALASPAPVGEPEPGAAVRPDRQAALSSDALELGRRIAAAGARRPWLAGDLPRRPSHGDLKISNLLFAPAPPARALCLIDLDTLGRQTLAFELGDALRSWCNPAGEDTARTRFDLALFTAAIEGYAAGAAGLLTPAEIGSILPGLENVCIELAARFCADVFEDRYFGWDPTRFGSRRHHNLVRAQGQMHLADQVHAALPAARAALDRAFAAV